MQSKEAIELLDKKLTAGKGSAAKSLLAKELEYIPLAMTQATAYIAGHERMTIEKYLNDLLGNQHSGSMLLMNEGNYIGKPTEIPKSMLMTWRISFNQISEKFPPAARLLSQMSMYDRLHVPQTLLAAGADEKPFDLEGALNILLRYSFIDQESDEKHFSMQLLVQQATKEWLRQHDKLEPERETAVHKLATQYPSGEYAHWQTCQALEPHVQAVLEHKQLSSHAKVARAKLLFNRGWYFWLRGNYKEAEETIWQSLADRLECLRPQDPDIFSSSALLALVLRYQGKYSAAEDMSRRALVGRQAHLGPDHPDTLTSLENLALVLQDRNDFEKAENMCRQALAGRERCLRFDHPDILTSCNNLALVLKDRNKFEEAEQLCRRALIGRERELRIDHPDTLTSCNNLGILLLYRKMYDEAEEMCRRALNGRERKLGSEHPDTLESLDNLGVVLRYRLMYGEAEKMSRRALAGREHRLGPDHPDTLISLDNLAMVLHDQGKYIEAESTSRRVIETRVKLSDPGELSTITSLSTLTSLSYLARTLRSQGKYTEAERYYRRVLTGIESLGFEPDHPVRRKAAENLSLVLRDKNVEACESDR
jgi:tetratricopeptide (TPR) repeat protein